MNQVEEKLVTVFSTSNRGIFLVAKSILEGSDIQYFTKHEYLEALAYGAGSQDIQVFEKDEESAKILLESIDENIPEINIEEIQRDEENYRYTILAILVIIIVIFIFVLL